MRYDSPDYPENSREAILRIAILAVDADGDWHELEREYLAEVYRNICVMLDDDLDEEELLREVEDILNDVSYQIGDLTDTDDSDEYWQDCLDAITSEDLQHVAVGAAMTLSGGSSETDADELAGVTRLCDEWGVDVIDALDIWND